MSLRDLGACALVALWCWFALLGFVAVVVWLWP